MSHRSKTSVSLAILLLAAIACLKPLAAARAFDDPQTAGHRPEKLRTILVSESWQKTMNGLNDWLSTQPIYDRKEVEAIKKDLSGRLEKMSLQEIQAFQEDLDAKLEMALGPEGRDILGWVAASWAAAAPAYRKKMDLQYPDLMKLTAAQLREELDFLEGKRSAARIQSARIGQSRQARIAARQAEQFQGRERALNRGTSGSAGGGGYRTPYHPQGMRQYPDVVAGQNYGWGFGWGFGFW